MAHFVDFDLMHDVFPGRHLYQFYKSKDDLLKVMLRYWEAGIAGGNFCFWSVPSSMSVEEARNYLNRYLPSFYPYFLNGGFELVEHAEWYGDWDAFDGNEVTQKYVEKMRLAIAHGYSVIRIAGDITGLKAEHWPAFRAYERNAHELLKKGDLPCIALCSYPIHELGLPETKDVLDSHHGVLVAKV